MYEKYIQPMETSHHVRGDAPKTPVPSLGDYANLRRGGSSAAQAGALLCMGAKTRAHMERAFRGQVARGAGEAQPRFARHDRHVAAVMKAGGFPALTERRVGRNGVRLSLPLVWPAGER